MSLPAEDIRFEVRRFLANRPTASFDAETIAHNLARKGNEVTKDEVTAACTFLTGLSPAQVMGTITSLGSTHRYQISSAGILAYERNE